MWSPKTLKFSANFIFFLIEIQQNQKKTNNMQTIHNYDFSGKKALIRVDFNVPLNENFEITNDTR